MCLILAFLPTVVIICISLITKEIESLYVFIAHS